MSTLTWAIYIDEIGEALTTEIFAAVGSSLSIKKYMQGNLQQLPADFTDWPNLLPAILVEFKSMDFLHSAPTGTRADIAYTFTVAFVRQQADSENPKRVLNKALSKIAAATATGGAHFLLSSLDGTPGLEVMHVFPRHIEGATDQQLDQMDYRISVGLVEVEVHTQSSAF